MVKMSDVAKLANVSTATVSRVLRNPETVKENTRKKVLNVIEQLNYQPNILARHFRRNETNTILVMVPNILNTVFTGIIEGIESEAARNGYRVLLGNTNKSVENEYGLIDLLKQKQTDGMILFSARMDPKTLVNLSEEYPIVLTTAYIDGLKVPTVSIDNISSSRNAVAHLIKLGHTRIAHISGPLEFNGSRDRYKGYQQALLQNDLEIDSMLVQEGDFTLESGYNLMLKFIAMEHPPTAVFTGNDEMAMGVIKAAKDHGLKVPEDLAVVGFDNISFSAIFEPALTTIAQPLFKMGQVSMQLLLQQIQGVQVSKIQHILESELIIRDSCGGKGKKK
ncbi:LacI family DNA-binding transcriptional regulator [Metabacillus sediminilitoris]|uniref:LacI family transcriptional regulator n=1 Tax=Metabacillus sediminilitoris TaxID=2567941 RepID=A0A4V3WF22_9BACI|nr:LacI family DNA-binding transcriptional regulator [Metabacillus sediminilitoris]QGQ45017.1 LacI family DNA-binding transcriptional regulator [Metabacillus sediminilitoris]THF78649.1 LacI family transcriptional regulator [Metabacillus sediminilitoris]